jgi:hypothetical protein
MATTRQLVKARPYRYGRNPVTLGAGLSYLGLTPSRMILACVWSGFALLHPAVGVFLHLREPGKIKLSIHFQE